MDIPLLKEWIASSNKIVFLGGAGVSTESGIPDFRSDKGLYRQKARYSPEEMLSHDFFMTHPDKFYDFYRSNSIHTQALPNKAHQALAQLENEGRLSCIVTQNIDGLHQKAGSINVLELHGSIYRNYCMDCHKKYDLEKIVSSKALPLCSCGGMIRPDVVLYGEPLNSEVIEKTLEFISACDMLIVGGTSLQVYPAAGFVAYYRGSRLVIINKTPTPADREADLVLHGSIGEILGTAVSEN